MSAEYVILEGVPSAGPIKMVLVRADYYEQNKREHNLEDKNYFVGVTEVRQVDTCTIDTDEYEVELPPTLEGEI